MYIPQIFYPNTLSLQWKTPNILLLSCLYLTQIRNNVVSALVSLLLTLNQPHRLDWTVNSFLSFFWGIQYTYLRYTCLYIYVWFKCTRTGVSWLPHTVVSFIKGRKKSQKKYQGPKGPTKVWLDNPMSSGKKPKSSS